MHNNFLFIFLHFVSFTNAYLESRGGGGGVWWCSSFAAHKAPGDL